MVFLEKKGLRYEDLYSLYNHLELVLNKHDIDANIRIKIQKECAIPVSIFTQELGITEAVVKYLKENLNFSNKQISHILHKSQNNIAVTYYKAKKKSPGKLEKESEISLNLDIFKPGLTALESIVLHMRDELEFSNHRTAELLDREDSTIWATYQRATKKNEE